MGNLYAESLSFGEFSLAAHGNATLIAVELLEANIFMVSIKKNQHGVGSQ
jgi:hypothetical protein